MKEMIRKYVVSIVCMLATLFITGSAWAAIPTPIAQFSGETLAPNSTSGGFTISCELGAAYANRVITLTKTDGADNKGAMITVPSSFAGDTLTAVITYSDFDVSDVNNSLFSFASAAGAGSEIVGYVTGSGSSKTLKCAINDSQKDDGTVTYTVQQAGTMIISLNKSASILKYGFDAGTTAYSRSGATASSFNTILIGGCYKGVGSYHRPGLKISDIKIYDISYDAYTADTKWIGPVTGGDWATAENWSNGVPENGKSAYIGAGNAVNWTVSDDVSSSVKIHGPGAVHKKGSGTLTLSGASTISGGFYIDEGTAKAGVGGTSTTSAFGTGTIYIANGATFNLGGKQFNTNGLGYTVECAGTITNSDDTTEVDIDGWGKAIKNLTLTGDSTATGDYWVVGTGNGGGKTSIVMNEHTLTVNMTDGNFALEETEITGGGIINLKKGGLRTNGGESFDGLLRINGGYAEVNTTAGSAMSVKDIEIISGDPNKGGAFTVTGSIASKVALTKGLTLAAGAKIIAPLSVTAGSFTCADAKCKIDASQFVGVPKGTLLTLGSAPDLANFEITGLDDDVTISVDGNSIVFKKNGVVESWAELKAAIEAGTEYIMTYGDISASADDTLTLTKATTIELFGNITGSTINFAGAGDITINAGSYTCAAINAAQLTGAVTITTANSVAVNAGSNALTYNYNGETAITPSITCTGAFTKGGTGTINRASTLSPSSITVNGGVFHAPEDYYPTITITMNDGGVYEVVGKGSTNIEPTLVFNGGTYRVVTTDTGHGNIQHQNITFNADSIIENSVQLYSIAGGHDQFNYNLNGYKLTKKGAGNYQLNTPNFVGGGSIEVQDGSMTLACPNLPSDATLNVTIANGKTLTINSTNNKSGSFVGDFNVVNDGGTFTVNRDITVNNLSGTGTFNGSNTLTVKGILSLPVSATETAMISGNLTLASGATIRFPAGAEAGTQFKLCGGTLSGDGATSGEAVFYVGDTMKIGTLTFADKAVSYADAVNCFIVGDGCKVSDINAKFGSGEDVLLIMSKDATIEADEAALANLSVSGDDYVLTVTGAENFAITMDVGSIVTSNFTGALTVTTSTGIAVNAGTSALTYNYTGEGTISPEITCSGAFTKGGTGTVNIPDALNPASITVAAGVAKFTANSSYGQSKLIKVLAGGQVDCAPDGTKSQWKYELAGFGPDNTGALIVRNEGSHGSCNVGEGALTLTDNASINVPSDKTWYFVSPDYHNNTIELNNHTLSLVGEGTFSLSNTTVQNGTIEVKSGTLSKNDNRSWTFTSVDLVVDGGTLNLSDNLSPKKFTYTSGTVSGSSTLTVTGVLTFGDGVTLPAVTLTGSEINVASGAANISAITCANGFTKTGVGTLNLPANYTGAVTLSAGALNNTFSGTLTIAGDFTYAKEKLPLLATLAGSGHTGSITLPEGYFGQIAKITGEGKPSDLVIKDSTDTEIAADKFVKDNDGYLVLKSDEIRTIAEISHPTEFIGDMNFGEGGGVTVKFATPNTPMYYTTGAITVADGTTAAITLDLYGQYEKDTKFIMLKGKTLPDSVEKFDCNLGATPTGTEIAATIEDTDDGNKALVFTITASLLSSQSDATKAALAKAVADFDAGRLETLTKDDIGNVTAWANRGTGTTTYDATLTGDGRRAGNVSPVFAIENGRAILDFGECNSQKDLGYTRVAIKAAIQVVQLKNDKRAFYLGDYGGVNEKGDAQGKYSFHRDQSDSNPPLFNTGNAKEFAVHDNGIDRGRGTSGIFPDTLRIISVATEKPECYTDCFSTDRNNGDGRSGGRKLCETLLFTEALTDAERVAIETYLNQKWGIYEELNYSTDVSVSTINADIADLDGFTITIADGATLTIDEAISKALPIKYAGDNFKVAAGADYSPTDDDLAKFDLTGGYTKITYNCFMPTSLIAAKDGTVTRFEYDNSVGYALNFPAGIYEFSNAKITNNLNKDYTIRIQNGDSVWLDRTNTDTSNYSSMSANIVVIDGALKIGRDNDAAVWYGADTTYTQTGGTVTCPVTGTGTTGNGNGFLLGINASGLSTLSISGGELLIPNSSINFWINSQVQLSGTGKIQAKGIYKGGNTNNSRVTISDNATFELGSIGWSGIPLTLNGGTFKAIDTTTLSAALTVDSAATIDVAEGKTLTISGAITGSANITKTGAGTLTLTGANTYTGETTIDAGKVIFNGNFNNNNYIINENGEAEFTVDTTVENYKKPTITTLNGSLSLTVNTTSDAARSGQPISIGTLPIGADPEKVSATLIDKESGETIPSDITIDETGAVTIKLHIDTFTLTPAASGEFIWAKEDGSLFDDSKTWVDYGNVSFNTTVYTTSVAVPALINASNIELGGTYNFSGSPVVANKLSTLEGAAATFANDVVATDVAITDGTVGVASLTANDVAIENATLDAKVVGPSMKYVRLTITETQQPNNQPAVGEFRLYRGSATTGYTIVDWPIGTKVTDGYGNPYTKNLTATKNETGYPAMVGTKNEEQPGCLIDGYYGDRQDVTPYTQPDNPRTWKLNKWWLRDKAGPWVVTIEFPYPVATFSGCNFCLADHEPRNPTAWTIEVSSDGKTWTTVNETTGATWTSQYAWNGGNENVPAFLNNHTTPTEVTIGGTSTIVADGNWTVDLEVSGNLTLKGVADKHLTLDAASTSSFGEGAKLKFDLSDYAVTKAGRQYVIAGPTGGWPSKEDITVEPKGVYEVGVDDFGYYVEVQSGSYWIGGTGDWKVADPEAMMWGENAESTTGLVWLNGVGANFTRNANMTIAEGVAPTVITIGGEEAVAVTFSGELDSINGVPINFSQANATLTINVAEGETFEPGLITEVSGVAGKIVKTGPGTLVLSQENTFTGGVTVNGGLVKLGSASTNNTGTHKTCLGTGSVTIDGGTVDFNGIYADNVNFTIKGEGYDGNGALINTGADLNSSPTIGTITLAGNATVGGTGLFYSDSHTINFGNGYVLTKKGTFQFPMRNNTFSGSGKFIVAEGTFSNNYGNNGAAIVDFEIQDGATLTLSGTSQSGNSLTVRDFKCSGTISGDAATLKVNGTLYGGVTIPKLELANGATIDTTDSLTVNALTLGNSLNLTNGNAGDTIISGLTAEPTTLPTITVGGQPANLKLVYESGKLMLKEIIDATVEGSVGYNYTGIFVDVDITSIDGDDMKFIKVIAKDAGGHVVGQSDNVTVDGVGPYTISVDNLTSGVVYTYEVQFLGEDEKTVKIANLDSGDVMLGKNTMFSASAETGASVVDGGEWAEENAPKIPTGANYYAITDEPSIFNVTTEESASSVTMSFDITFEDDFTTEIDPVADGAQAGVTISNEDGDETLYWYVCDGGTWKATTTEATAGSYTVTMEFDYTSNKTVRYSVSGEDGTVVLEDADGTTWFTLGGESPEKISFVSFSGESQLAKFDAIASTIDTTLAKNGDVKYTTVADVVAAINNGDSVTLLTNVSIDLDSLTDGTRTIDVNGNKFKWNESEKKFITIDKDGNFVVKAITDDTKPKNGFSSFDSYVLNLNPEEPTSKPIGDAPADNGDPDTLTVEIKGPDGEELKPREGYTVNYIATELKAGTETDKAIKVISNTPQIDLPLPTSGEVKYTITVEVVK